MHFSIFKIISLFIQKTNIIFKIILKIIHFLFKYLVRSKYQYYNTIIIQYIILYYLHNIRWIDINILKLLC